MDLLFSLQQGLYSISFLYIYIFLPLPVFDFLTIRLRPHSHHHYAGIKVVTYEQRFLCMTESAKNFAGSLDAHGL